jgi:hypothetical protein
MKISDLFEDISPAELDQVERVADQLWSQYDIDVEFTRHFLDRVNDPRNGKPITPEELVALFKKEYQEYGRDIADLDANAEAVMKDVFSKLNLPFVINDRGRERNLVAKTIMRKPNFKTSNKEFPVR